MRNPFSSLPPYVINGMAEGAKKYKYKGLRCLKVPTEMALYTLLIGELQPRTVFEIGTKEGGSALWMADQMKTHGLDGRVITIDVNKPSPWYENKRKDITLLRGNAANLGEVLTDEVLGLLLRPWMVVEDSSHRSGDTLAVLRFFDEKMQAGEYIVIEDGVVADLGRAYEFDGGPLAAIAQFLPECDGRYGIDAGLCDFYGHNATGNPNGYLRRL